MPMPRTHTVELSLGPATGRLLADRAGWAHWRLPDGRHAQLRILDDGRLHLADLWLHGQVTASELRSLPLGRLEVAINGPRPAALLRDLFAVPPMSGSTDLSPGGPGIDEAWLAEPVEKSKRRNLRVKIPEGRSRPDGFYAGIADLFSEAATQSLSPARDLAEANRVPVTTVHRWLKEARRRGLLGPAQVTKARIEAGREAEARLQAMEADAWRRKTKGRG